MYDNGLGRRRQDAHPMRFWAGGEVSFPWLSDGMWFLTQVPPLGLLKQAPDYLAVASRINRIDVLAGCRPGGRRDQRAGSQDAQQHTNGRDGLERVRPGRLRPPFLYST